MNPPEPHSLHVLLVSDWSVDADAVIEAARRRYGSDPVEFRLLVPAWLHGLDWAGDPEASRPCAQRHVDAVTALAAQAGLSLTDGQVGDADPMAAIGDVIGHGRTDELLLCTRRRLLRGPLGFGQRVHRLTGLPVATEEPRRRWHRRSGHCTVKLPRAQAA